MNNNQKAFLALVRAGLWEKEVRLYAYENLSFDTLFLLSEEQTLVGVVLAGLEHSDVKPQQELLLQWIGKVQLIERQNKAMNVFVAKLVSQLREANIYTILVKGQGIAQCYERPLWRACGDVDFLLSDSDYLTAKDYLMAMSSNVDREDPYEKHIGFTIGSWLVEIHGSLKTGISTRIDKGVIALQKDVFYSGNVRSWLNDNTQVFLPGVNCDVLFVFTHILKHFFHNGIGLRQICDWCRFIWVYRDTIDVRILESRVRSLGIRTEWKAFAALAVNHLGMPKDAMPLYSDDKKWVKKADQILKVILNAGNFGHNRDVSYSVKYPKTISKLISLCRHTSDSVSYIHIFPMDSIKSWINMLCLGLRNLVH